MELFFKIKRYIKATNLQGLKFAVFLATTEDFMECFLMKH
jgi:hypothetical protein